MSQCVGYARGTTKWSSPTSAPRTERIIWVRGGTAARERGNGAIKDKTDFKK